MHDGTTEHPPHHAPVHGGVPTPAPVHGSNVHGIVDDAMAATVTAPPASRSARRRAERIGKAQAKALAPRSRTHAPGRTSSTTTMILWGLFGMVALGAVAILSGLVQLGPPGTGPNDAPGGTSRNGTWSYYHDQNYDSSSQGAKWSTDRTRSSDPDEAVLGDSSRWEYDGPYRYGPYGSDGMRRRSTGRESADPLYSQPAPTQDVFRQYGGDLDPSGGQPVGTAPSSMTSPYYDPYAGYSNPYANRIRLGYGEGVGRGASYTP